MANGFPLSALAGRREIMRLGGFADDADRVFLLSQTYAAQPWALAAMLAVIDTYEREQIAERLHLIGAELRRGIEEVVADAGLSPYFQLRGRDCNLVYVARDAIRAAQPGVPHAGAAGVPGPRASWPRRSWCARPTTRPRSSRPSMRWPN